MERQSPDAGPTGLPGHGVQEASPDALALDLIGHRQGHVVLARAGRPDAMSDTHESVAEPGADGRVGLAVYRAQPRQRPGGQAGHG